MIFRQIFVFPWNLKLLADALHKFWVHVVISAHLVVLERANWFFTHKCLIFVPHYVCLDSSDEEGGENSESGNESDASDGENPAKKSQKTEKAPKDTKARLAGAISALLGDDTTPAKASASVSSAESDSDVDEDAMDAVPILSDVRKTSAQRRAEKKAAKDAERVQRELRLQRKLLKNKDHVVLDGQTNNVEKEVRLRKIGTKGVVKLFNAIRSAQKEGEVVTSTAKTKKQKEKGPFSRNELAKISRI